MKVGMLWFDADRELAVEHRVERAATYYREKYGKAPTLCLVHPETGQGKLPARIGQLDIEAMDTVQPNHFWVGVKPPSTDQDSA
jgi:hypothetical protein